MVRCGSLLSQILGLVPRVEFGEIARRRGAERACKGFSTWDPFVAMLFCPLGQAHLLREIVGGLGSTLGKKVHMGLRGTPKRSTLSYANAHRPWQVYPDVFYALLDRGAGMLQGRLKHPLRFKSPLFSMDASVIDLCLSIFPWAEFRQTKGVRIPEKNTAMVLVTHHLAFGPTTIAAIYKERWQIELFFKAIQQNLRIETFVGTSKNALLTQIGTALIAILMLKILALRSKLGWSLSTLAALLRWNLFAYRDLWEWVDNPYGPPPWEELFEQPSLFDNAFGQHLTQPQRGTSS